MEPRKAETTTGRVVDFQVAAFSVFQLSYFLPRKRHLRLPPQTPNQQGWGTHKRRWPGQREQKNGDYSSDQYPCFFASDCANEQYTENEHTQPRHIAENWRNPKNKGCTVPLCTG